MFDTNDTQKTQNKTHFKNIPSKSINLLFFVHNSHVFWQLFATLF